MGSRPLPGRIVQLVFGWLLLVAFVVYWVESFLQPPHAMLFGKETWVYAWDVLGLDFYHSFWAVKHWLIMGGNPYSEYFGDPRGLYSFPPIVLLLHAWCRYFDYPAAVGIWMTANTVIMSAAVVLAVKLRREAGRACITLPLALGLVLISTPVLFTIERGNCDSLVLLSIILGAASLRLPGSIWRDLALGVCVAVASWVKIYPTIIIMGLLVICEWRAAVIAVVVWVLIGVASFLAVPEWLTLSSHYQNNRVAFINDLFVWLRHPFAPRERQGSFAITFYAHSLTAYWEQFWYMVGVNWLANLPGLIGSALVLGPMTLWVNYRVYRSANRQALAFPYFLWLTLVGNFAMPISFDYNLIGIPIAMVMLWRRRLSPLTHVLFAAFLFYWQPLRVAPEDLADVLFFSKFAGMVGIAMALSRFSRDPAYTDAAGTADRITVRVPAPDNPAHA